MLEKIVSKLHILIIFYAAWSGWQQWLGMTEGLDGLNMERDSLNARVKKLSKDKKEVAKFLKDIEKAKEKMKLVEEEVRVIQRKLPEKIDDSENLGKIKGIAQNLNIQNIFLAPGKEDNRGFYYAKKYDLTATGTYLQFLLFFEKLSTSERLYNVVDIELSKSDVVQRGRYQLVSGKFAIESFRYNLNYEQQKEQKEMKDDKKGRKK